MRAPANTSELWSWREMVGVANEANHSQVRYITLSNSASEQTIGIYYWDGVRGYSGNRTMVRDPLSGKTEQLTEYQNVMLAVSTLMNNDWHCAPKHASGPRSIVPSSAGAASPDCSFNSTAGFILVQQQLWMDLEELEWVHNASVESVPLQATPAP